MRFLPPGELAGKTCFMLRCLDWLNQIMSERGQLKGSTPSVLYPYFMLKNWVIYSK